ncbi:MAG TPA: diguanylate cyclase [Solirubrobacteraceae bacterium]|nr:diguanylate cyclase [Solirubrobacteraceae bacterium]
MKDQPDQSISSSAAAERLVRAARAAQQLSDVLWETLQEELSGGPQAERVRELSERLGEVSSTVALLAVTPGASATGSDAPDSKFDSVGGQRTRDEPEAFGAGGAVGARAATAGSTQAGTPPVNSPQGVAGSDEPSVERRRPPAPSRPETSPPAALQSIPTSAGEYTFTKLVDEQEQAAAQQPLASVEPIQPEIEIRDVRREEGPSAWVSSVGRLLARHAEDGLPFAVLLVEIVDVARLERSETPHDLHGLVAQVESALGRGMRATDRLSRETLGRYWLVAPETNGTGAQMLAERLARLVRTSATHRNVPMEVAIGIAVCPDDGTEAPALAARADLGVYSARATGRSIAHTDPPTAS